MTSILLGAMWLAPPIVATLVSQGARQRAELGRANDDARLAFEAAITGGYVSALISSLLLFLR